MFLQIRSGSNGRQLKDFYAIFWLSGRFWRLVSLLLTTDGTLLQISWHVLFSNPKNIVVDEESIENNEFLVIDIFLWYSTTISGYGKVYYYRDDDFFRPLGCILGINSRFGKQ